MLRAVFTRGRRLCNGKASHEFTEAITDPELNAWFTAQGNEIGDHLCAYDYGLFYNWDGGNANQMWNSRFYMLQTEYDNNQPASRPLEFAKRLKIFAAGRIFFRSRCSSRASTGLAA
jgi:hypothetical protein